MHALTKQEVSGFIDAEAAKPLAVVPLTPLAAMDLITLSPEKFTAEVYRQFNTKLDQLIDEVRSVDYDVKTTAGMKVAVECRAMFRDLRILADKERKNRKAPITAIGKLLESGYNTIEERITPLEDLFDGDIKAEESRKADAKAAEIAAERVRTEGIQKMIDNLRDYPRMILASDPHVLSVALKAAIDEFDGWAPHEDDYAEFVPAAAAVIAESLATMRTMFDAAAAKEAAAAQAQADREAEAARIVADREELAQLQAAAAITAKAERDEMDRQRAELAETARLAKVESDRVANEQAIERNRLADLAAEQEVIAKAARDQAAAVLQLAADELAEREAQFQREKDAHAEEMRLAAEALLPRAPEPVALVTPEPAPALEEIAAPAPEEAPAPPAALPVELPRPSDTEIILAIANTFGVSPATAHEWILAVTA